MKMNYTDDKVDEYKLLHFLRQRSKLPGMKRGRKAANANGKVIYSGGKLSFSTLEQYSNAIVDLWKHQHSLDLGKRGLREPQRPALVGKFLTNYKVEQQTLELESFRDRGNDPLIN